MTENVSTLEVRQRLGDLLNRVALRHDEFVIERKGKPLAALVPVDKLESMRRLARQNLRKLLEQAKGGPLTQHEADTLANEAKHQTRIPARRRRARR